MWVEGAVCVGGFCWRCDCSSFGDGGGGDGLGDRGGSGGRRGAPSSHGLGTALAVFVQRGGVRAADVVDFVADLDEVDGCVCYRVIGGGSGVGGVVEDVGVDHEADFGGQKLKEGAGWLGGAVCWCCCWYGIIVGRGGRTAYLTRLDQFADGFWPSFAGGIVVEDGIGVAEDPGVEVAHGVYSSIVVSF